MIGAGIAGLSVAYELAAEGKTVIVIDADTPGGGETGRTTAHLMTAFDDRYAEVERHLGAEAARMAAMSHAAAVDRIEAICRDEAIDCGFERVDGYLFAPTPRDADLLAKELEAAHRAGLRDVDRVDSVPTGKMDLGPALRFRRQGQLHPLRYLGGLIDAILRRGGQVYGHTRALEVEDGTPVSVRTAGGHRIQAGTAIVATNTPFNDRFAIHTKQAAYRTFVVGMRVPRGSVPNYQFWDTPDPYHYVRIAGDVDAGHQLLISGGEDHKVGQADDASQRFERLVAWTRERFPTIDEPLFAWSGQVMEPVDGVAFIGRNPGETNVYVVTGDSGNGMTHGAIAGMLIRDLVTERSNAWADIYDPSRKSLSAFLEYARENANVALQYADWLGGGAGMALDAIPIGTGAVVKAGGRHIAAFHDAAGTLNTFDATCPHLKCLVQWNSLEKSFDCPCHGSRFGCDGKVLHGPANVDLPVVAVAEDRSRQ
ncbi:FAD-dependent oxidoreductase [Cupriavidus necator]|uniref:FAD-dependent oxidoreductase n=1 Tax=Cupriavidus necator TaxID=106590 RepID=UPI00339D6F2C